MIVDTGAGRSPFAKVRPVVAKVCCADGNLRAPTSITKGGFFRWFEATPVMVAVLALSSVERLESRRGARAMGFASPVSPLRCPTRPTTPATAPPGALATKSIMRHLGHEPTRRQLPSPCSSGPGLIAGAHSDHIVEPGSAVTSAFDSGRDHQRILVLIEESTLGKVSRRVGFGQKPPLAGNAR